MFDRGGVATPTVETACRARAVARLLSHVRTEHIQTDDAFLKSLEQLAARCALWAAVAEREAA
jgi:hypothetical protein